EPEQPLESRTEASRRWSSQRESRLTPSESFTRVTGASSKGHIPSSANARPPTPSTSTARVAAKAIRNIGRELTAGPGFRPCTVRPRAKAFPAACQRRHSRGTSEVRGRDAAVAAVRNQASIDAAMRVLDDFMAAFNARDIAAWQKTFNFPSVRLASNTLT